MTTVPDRMRTLPIDPQRGVPVPWFVAWIDGKPDFRVIGVNKLATAHKFDLCWVCGQPCGRFGSFVIGPMCSITRTNSEPPSHRDCAIYSATNCPFLTRPKMRRREAGLPEHKEAAGCPIDRNPGVACVWTTREWKLFGDGRGGTLWKMGDPTETLWFAQGREATRAEVEESVRTGLPSLREMADLDGPRAHAELTRMADVAARYYPVSP